MKYDISVIVPAYNCEKFIERSINSLLKQTKDKLEIVIVDDGSKDSTGKICDQLRDNYPDIINVIHQENRGLTGAWKRGVEEATGEYVGFCDADDYVSEDMYQRLWDRIAGDGSDIACCGIRHIYEDNSQKEWCENSLFEEEYVDRKILVKKYYPQLISNGKFMGRTLLPNRVARVVKRELILNNMELCSNDVSIGEDMQLSLCIFTAAEKISIIHDFYPYYYYMNNESMTMVFDKNYMKKIQIMRDNLLRISNLKNVYDFSRQIYDDYLCLVVLNIKGCIYKQKNKKFKEIKEDLIEIVESDDIDTIIKETQLSKITMFEKIFLMLIRKRMYLLMYMCIRTYFR